jgi:type IV pilus assembly protein PilC
MRFEYQGLTSSGEEKHGTLQASDQDTAVSKLQSKGIFATQLRTIEANDSSGSSESLQDILDQISAYLPVKTSQKVFFFRQMALMFRSGLSVTEALNILETVQRGKLRLIVKDLNAQISGGKSFSQALETYEHIFTPLALHMIRSAENSGELEPALIRIADFLERKQEIKTQLISTMTYPLVVLLMTIGVFIFMMLTVIPKFAGFFERSGRTPPAEMLQLMGIANFLSTHWYFLVVGFVVITGGIIYTYSTREGRLYIDILLLKVPLVGSMISASAMSQITWGLSSLLQSGVSVVRSLEIISNLIGNKAISGDITDASEEILRGADMGKSFRKPFIEELIQQMVMVGERSGSMINIMRDAGQFYEERIRNITKAIAAATEPAAILLIGGIVGYVYYAFFKSMFSISG